MRDDFLTREWADNRHHLFDTMLFAARRWGDEIRIALDRVHAYEFDAPWHRVPARPSDNPID